MSKQANYKSQQQEASKQKTSETERDRQGQANKQSPQGDRECATEKGNKARPQDDAAAKRSGSYESEFEGNVEGMEKQGRKDNIEHHNF